MVALLCAPHQAGAQDARDSAVARAARAVATLRDNELIRVAFLRSRFVGHYMGTRGDTLLFGDPGNYPMAFRFNAVDTIWRSGRATWTGLTIGAITGGIAGGVFVRGGTTARAAAVLGSAAAGGVVGALIGRASRSWRRIYP